MGYSSPNKFCYRQSNDFAIRTMFEIFEYYIVIHLLYFALVDQRVQQCYIYAMKCQEVPYSLKFLRVKIFVDFVDFGVPM